MTIRIAVLASGRGSNLEAILQAIATGQLDAEVIGVFSDKPEAPALQRVPPAARWSRDAKAFPDRASFDSALADAVAASRPSLLPKYRGLQTHARALQAGDAEHGASVHFVVPELDAGTVIMQAVVPVLAGDAPDTLAARVLQVEHPLLVAALQLVAAGRMSEQDGVAWLDGQPLFTPLRLQFAAP